MKNNFDTAGGETPRRARSAGAISLVNLLGKCRARSSIIICILSVFVLAITIAAVLRTESPQERSPSGPLQAPSAEVAVESNAPILLQGRKEQDDRKEHRQAEALSAVEDEYQEEASPIPDRIKRIVEAYGGTIEEYRERQKLVETLLNIQQTSPAHAFETQILRAGLDSKPEEILQSVIQAREKMESSSELNADIREQLRKRIKTLCDTFREDYTTTKRQYGLNVPLADITYKKLLARDRDRISMYQALDQRLKPLLSEFDVFCQITIGPRRAGGGCLVPIVRDDRP